jgi:two-component system chemotaxis response regulator CheY
MKKIIIVGIPDKYLKNIISYIETKYPQTKLNKIYTSFQFFNEYKNGDADIIFLDSSIPDKGILPLAKQIRDKDKNVFIIGVSLHKDPIEINQFKKIDKTDYILKADNNEIIIDKLLQENSKQPNNSYLKTDINIGEKHILIVDDFENTLNIVKYTLEQANFKVIPALSGREALQKLNSYPKPDLIITDLNMPQMDGFQLIEAIRKNPEFDKIPIFILTTEFSMAKKMQAKKLNITGWIQKPYNINEFLNTIVNALK